MQKSWAEDSDSTSAMPSCSVVPKQHISNSCTCSNKTSLYLYSFVQPECTFILLDPALPDTEGTGQHGGGKTTLSPNPASRSCCS